MVYSNSRRDSVKKFEVKQNDIEKIKGIIINIIENQKKEAYVVDNYKHTPKKDKNLNVSLSR
jgi:hypothetical protein